MKQNTKTIRERFKNGIFRLDGGMGTLLQERGLGAGESPERWNLTHPEVIEEIHFAYFAAGSDAVCVNTFGANPFHFGDAELETIIRSAFENADRARKRVGGERYLALDIGPTGRLLKPFGDLDFEDAVSAFAHVVRLGVRFGADLILIETMNDCYETKAALLAAKENSDLPILVSNAYGADGHLMTGATPEAMVALAEGMGADAIGANCSLGPQQLRPVVDELLRCASIPVLLKPNAGLPREENGKTVFDVKATKFVEEVVDTVRQGVRIVGGCCGTSPEYLQALFQALNGIPVPPLTEKNRTCVSSYTHAVRFGETPVLIGERINPTGKKRFQQALRERDMDYLLREGLRQEACGAHILDVNVGLPDVEEASLLVQVVEELQAVTALPLQLDTSDRDAMERAMRRYNGKALINSVSGKEESMHAVFPLVKKYGGTVIALTLDENGIPDTTEERVRIAFRILQVASSYGIAKKDLIFDPLAMAVSADKQAAIVTLETVRRLNEMGCRTSLGVSNVSFGLPYREVLNSTFFTCALEQGLSAAILNPEQTAMMKSYYAFCALHGQDPNCGSYLRFAASLREETAGTVVPSDSKPHTEQTESHSSLLRTAIVEGRKRVAAEQTRCLLETAEPLAVVKQEIIPALDEVGRGFEEKTVYLPQLLMSAEAAKCAFEEIKIKMSVSADAVQPNRPTVILATVKGDIHDIGKNIVKLLIENYGYPVCDLGKDVPPEAVPEAVKRTGAACVGLSALMTTTVPAMEETVRLLHEKVPHCKVMVGGAVLTEEYAQRIGADRYAPNAMDAVRYLEELFG